MGMFDWIDFEESCPDCGETITEWQSKSGPCQLLVLQPWDVECFYSSCDNCRRWVEYSIKKPLDAPYQLEGPPENWLDNYNRYGEDE